MIHPSTENLSGPRSGRHYFILFFDRFGVVDVILSLLIQESLWHYLYISRIQKVNYELKKCQKYS